MAHIGYESNGQKRYVCGGTLISDRYVMTAAHCKFVAKGITVSFVRLNSITSESRQAIYRNIEEIIVHPDYTTSRANDIALLRLDSLVRFELQRLRPACLWTEKEIKNTTAVVTGWGITGYGESASGVLLKGKLDLVEIDKCSSLGPGVALDEYHICATDLAGTKTDSCQGDSGGPLQVIQPDNPCQMHVLGVVSKGSICGVKNSRGLYVKVSKFIDWIEQVVWNA